MPFHLASLVLGAQQNLEPIPASAAWIHIQRSLVKISRTAERVTIRILGAIDYCDHASMIFIRFITVHK
jgi:hypothetical protein